MELRAYWERTDSTDEVEDDAGTFHLQWAFSVCSNTPVARYFLINGSPATAFEMRGLLDLE